MSEDPDYQKGFTDGQDDQKKNIKRKLKRVLNRAKLSRKVWAYRREILEVTE